MGKRVTRGWSTSTLRTTRVGSVGGGTCPRPAQQARRHNPNTHAPNKRQQTDNVERQPKGSNVRGRRRPTRGTGHLTPGNRHSTPGRAPPSPPPLVRLVGQAVRWGRAPDSTARRRRGAAPHLNLHALLCRWRPVQQLVVDVVAHTEKLRVSVRASKQHSGDAKAIPFWNLHQVWRGGLKEGTGEQCPRRGRGRGTHTR
jgi:hypothetical protein